MFCPKCGTEVDEEFDFYPVCGYDLRKVKEKLGLQKGILKPEKKQEKSREELKATEYLEREPKVSEKLFRR